MFRAWVLTSIMVLVVACTDNAKQFYSNCVTAEAKGDLVGATSACKAAISADPNSESGKAAAAKLTTLRSKTAADEDAKEKATKDWLVQEMMRGEGSKANKTGASSDVEALRAKVSKKVWDRDRDGDCTGKGLPPYRLSYEGGTYAEDERVAFADGCKHLFGTSSRETPNASIFCCPRF